MKIITIGGKLCRKFLPREISDVILQKWSAFISRKEIRNTAKLADGLRATKKKDKIELVFIVYMPETFTSLQTIYEAALKDVKFSVHILAQPHVDNQQGLLGKNPAYEYLKPLCQNVINAFENETWFELRNLSPDYVFYSRPYNHQYYSEYLPENVRNYAKVCFHQYSYDMDRTADFYTVYNYQFLRNVSFVFNSAESTRRRVKKMFPKTKSVYPKVLCLGFPRFELLRRELREVPLQTTVLWTPRWATGKKQGKKQTHFFDYVDDFFSFAERNKDINFIIRPHPLMFANFLQQGLISLEYIDDLYVKCNTLGNVEIDTDKTYFTSLRKATVLLSDYSALIVEFFVLGRPIVYCDDASTFNYETKRMDKTLYHANNWNEIESQLENLISGNDPMAEKRLSEIKLMMDERSAGKNIINCLKNDYFGDL